MKIKCNCGNDFEWEIYSFPQDDKGYIRKPCPSCHRAYEMTVRLIPENDKFWTV